MMMNVESQELIPKPDYDYIEAYDMELNRLQERRMGLLEQIKDDIIEVIAKRLEINPDTVVVNLDNTSHESRLVAEIPLLQSNGRRRATVQ